QAREAFYGMPMEVWKAQHQTEASAEKQEGFTRFCGKRQSPRLIRPVIHAKPYSIKAWL
ncbi:DUF1244 domain-containing protein, partial [Paracoccaceae bacterium]|nr:DUF1244 domain-containing protein [Paracoccaceae bacterium]